MTSSSTARNTKLFTALLLFSAMTLALSGCGKDAAETGGKAAASAPPASASVSPGSAAPIETDASAAPSTGSPAPSAREVDTDPDSAAVLVNKQYALPDGYNPPDLVYPDVPFLFKDKIEKRMMRKDAAAALEKLFAAAKEDGIVLAGVSAYRSHATQTALFQQYVDKDGEEKAKTYSAVPGHSEHETGLAIDVSGSDGKFAAEPGFAGSPEAKWLNDHAADYGFIIRYPEGKEAITGYTYEPWHIRYVGTAMAKEIMSTGSSLEEYYGAVPAAAQ